MTSEDSFGDGDSAADPAEDDGVLDPSDSLRGDLADDAVDGAMDAPERWSAGERYGTTLAEERAGESLDQQLAAEEPDTDIDSDPDSDPDPDPDAADGTWGAHDREQASAEEAAVHVVDPETPR